MNKMDFSELTKKRQNWVDANKENGFDEGISNLLTELYPDNAHFIYELLQNAEDADATEVKFELLQNELKFHHNGNPFTYDDIDGITSIGKGTKANDINKIGKFGVGFKAVFSYTKTPKIYSENYSFEIVDLVIPQPIKAIKRNNNTIIIFPFNNSNKSKQKAYNEIYNGLINIKDNTLLFLTNIKKLVYVIDDIAYKIERVERDDIIVEIKNSKNQTLTKWLRFKKKLSKKNKLYVSVAFNIGIDKETEKEYIKPINGQVSIFFPAEKEKSNLKFHIHAPFASTVARDSIKDLEENKKLINQISKLLLDGLKYIKKNGFLSYDFLSCMPNNSDFLPNFYRPIQDALIDYFNNQPFLITETNTYRLASECFLIETKEAKKVLTKDILKKFMLLFEGQKYKNIYYLDNTKKNYRERTFIETLNVKIITNSKLLKYLELLSSQNKMIIDTLQDENDKWFKDLYSFFSINISTIFYVTVNRKRFKKFILLSDNTLNVDEKNCYFSKVEVEYFSIVKESTYRYNHEAKRFLERIGVKNIGEKERIEIILRENYQDSLIEKRDNHLEDIEQFIDFYHKNKIDIDFFQKYYFIKSENGEYRKPMQIYIDTPFKETNISFIYKNEVNYFNLSKEYTLLKPSKKTIFIEFLEKLGAISSISIKKIDLKNRFLSKNYGVLRARLNDSTETVYCNFNDYDIDKTIILKSQNNIEISLLIWNMMRKLNKSFFYATYQANKKSEIVQTTSLLINTLKSFYKIPSKDGTFYTPDLISKNMLLDKFIYDNRNNWLDLIGFGESIKNNQKEYQEANKITKEKTGFNLKILEDAQKSGVTEEDIKQLAEEKRTQKLKESLRREQGVGNSPKFIQAKNSPIDIIDKNKYQESLSKENHSKEYKYENRITNYKYQDKNEVDKIRNFLYNEYEGHCQICGDTFAYNGRNTFKMKSLNIGKDRDINRKGNTLSLCYQHHAICEKKLREYSFLEEIENKNKLTIEDMDKIFDSYDWVDKEDKDLIYKAFYRLDDRDEFIRDEVYFLPIKMFSKDEYIKFTKAHLMEFIEVWNEN